LSGAILKPNPNSNSNLNLQHDLSMASVILGAWQTGAKQIPELTLQLLLQIGFKHTYL